MASLNLPFAIQPVNALSSVDNRYGPWTGCTQALTKTSGTRCVGLTVGIIESGAVVEYWFKTGVTNTDLVVKTMGGTGTLTGATNGIHLINSDTSVALGGDLNGDVYFSGGTIRYLSHPSFSADTQIVDKRYVDDIAMGLKPKQAVKVATVSGITLTGTPTPAVDGITLLNGDRVLVKNQGVGNTGSTQNGIYDYHSTGYTRSSDFDGTPASETVSGAYVWVLTGTTNENTAWVLDTPDPIIFTGVSASSLNFVVFANVADVVGLSGVTVSMNTGIHNVYLDSTAYCIRNYGITGATDGLTKLGNHSVCLGGSLSNNVTITTGANCFTLDNGSTTYLTFKPTCIVSEIDPVAGGSHYMRVTSGDVNLYSMDSGNCYTDITMRDGCFALDFTCWGRIYDSTPTPRGLQYNADYSAGYTARSLVDKAYVTGLTSVLGAPITGATNGLNNTGNTKVVCLGGTLSKHTTISGGAAYCINLTDFTRINLNAGNNCLCMVGVGAGTYLMNQASMGVQISHNYLGNNAALNIITGNASFSDNTPSSAGLQYGADYSANYTVRSLVDKGYVQSAVTSQLNTVNVYNVSANYTATTTSDFIGVTGGTAICIALPANPKAGQKITISDVRGTAVSDNIIICGNGRTIAGFGYATINTDYGSMSFINNNTGTSWSAVAWIN
jgi:hypothetical protein